MAKNKTMQDLYIELLEDSYDSEQQIVKALPNMVKAAHSQKLAKAFEKHLEETIDQVERLTEVFESLKINPKRKTCEATKGLIKEAEEMIKEKDELEDGVLDAGLIACGQKVEHYEIASYGTLCELARVLGYSDQHRILGSILKEEKKTDETLSEIASTINRVAKAA